MLTSQFLKGIMAEARPIIERQLADADIIAGLRDVFAAQGGDWSALKAVIKAQIQDENDETGDGKRIRKVLERAGNQTAYADMLGLNMNENNYIPAHDADGVVLDDEPQQLQSAVQMETAPTVQATSPAESEAVAISAPFAGSSNGRTAAFDAADAGSTPAPASTSTPKPLRPNCLKPHACGGQGKQHCWGCTQAMSKAGEVA